MELKRNAYDSLLRWKEKENGSSAILIEGARRVGKSYLARRFAENEYKSYIYIDFADIQKELLDVFENESHDLDLFFMKLESYYGVRLEKRNSCIIFDEVQMYPRARQMIKYLVADGRFDYIETGSLVSIRQNVENIVIPSEEDYIQLIDTLGEEIGREYGVRFLPSDFKKRNGYKRSIELSREYDLYRQDYCGCEFAWRGDNGDGACPV